MRISDWSSDVCSSDLLGIGKIGNRVERHLPQRLHATENQQQTRQQYQTPIAKRPFAEARNHAKSASRMPCLAACSDAAESSRHCPLTAPCRPTSSPDTTPASSSPVMTVCPGTGEKAPAARAPIPV